MQEGNTTAEQTLAAIWNDVLQRSGEIGPDERFFALGGDSVAMMMMLFRVEQALHVEISPEQVFEDDSFGTMVNRISNTGAKPSGASSRQEVPGASGERANG